jgi:uncharacterized membrane protein YhaH (DUF805 family)
MLPPGETIMLTALKHNLGQLLDFSGRTRPLHFWLYAAVVIMAGIAAMMVAMAITMNDMFARLGRFAREHPDQVEVIRTPSGTSWHVEGNHPELMPDASLFLMVVGIVAAVSVILLAAAVTRRLHDSNRRGWWGLLPLPFLATGLICFPTLFGSVLAGHEPDMRLFFLLFANNLIYLICLGVLVMLLCFSGTRGENRFGPPPV